MERLGRYVIKRLQLRKNRSDTVKQMDRITQECEEMQRHVGRLMDLLPGAIEGEHEELVKVL